MITIPYKYEPRTYQLPLLKAFDSGIRRGVWVAHRRSGKDKTAWNLTIKKACERVGTYLYAFPTYTQAKKVIWDGKDKNGFPFLGHIPPELLESKNETELKVKLRNGSIIQLVGTENIDSLVGTNPVGIVFSEWSLQAPSVWDLLRPILLENGGWALFIYTPRGKNHGHRLYQMAQHNDDWFCSRLTIDDTGVLTTADMDAERREGMSDELIQQEYYCSFEGSLEGAYYSKQLNQAEAEGRIGKVLHIPDIGVETWWDIGVSDSTAIWFTQTVGRDVHVIEYLEASGESIAHYAKELQSRPYLYTAHHGPHDLANREFGAVGQDGRPLSRVESARQYGIEFRLVPNVPLQSGIDTARMFMARCHFDAEKCARGLEALHSYHKEWDEKMKQFKSYPRHDWSSHGSDAFRYLSVGHKMTLVKESQKERAVQLGSGGASWMMG